MKTTISGEIESFWVVVIPRRYDGEIVAEVDDICFESYPKTIGLQFLGGLRPEEVVGFYADEKTAKEVATEVLTDETIEASVEKYGFDEAIRRAAVEDPGLIAVEIREED